MRFSVTHPTLAYLSGSILTFGGETVSSESISLKRYFEVKVTYF
jgi:hypothetical protein